jgi:hydrogenase expression/formation protein HypC
MCLGVPGLITEIREEDGLKMASVDFGGVVRDVCLDYVPEAKVGDYCLVHVGFALNLLTTDEAQETISLLNDIARIEQELPGGM